jgi:2-polyprenyl-3-methyl-5-hydroxy-6-metoxy-1,4-benzoquinol methylase
MKNNAYRFINFSKKINKLFLTEKYFVKIEPAYAVNYEENYHRIAIDPDGNKRFLHKERDLFLKNNIHIIKYLRRQKPGKILDLGCGMGWFMSVLSKKWNKVGVDCSKFALKNASNFCYTILSDVLSYTKKCNEKYDYILMSHVIEHLDNPVLVIKNLKKLLKKNGQLILETPDFDSPAARLFNNRFRLLIDPTHISLFTLDSLSRLLRDSGYKINDIIFPYFKTPYFNKKNLLRMLNYKKEKVSPPFYGSVMTFFCKKI